MDSLKKLSSDFFKLKLNLANSDVQPFQTAITRFCSSGSKEDAFSVYFCYCEIFKIFGLGYDTMGKLLELLSDHEYHSEELLTRHRDHYSHSVYVFSLGLAIYANDPSLRNIFRNFYGGDSFTATDFLYLWGMTALFHDIGYPFELAHDQIKAYSERVLEENNKLIPCVSYENINGLGRLDETLLKHCHYPLAKTLNELLAYTISDRLQYPLNILSDIFQKRGYDNNGYMDHAYFSALLFSHELIDARIDFSDAVLDVLSAIALHNSLNSKTITQMMGRNVAIGADKHPLAYLLILCDELQNWDRTAFGYVSKKDPLAWKVNLEITRGQIRVDYVFSDFNVLHYQEETDDHGQSSLLKTSRVNENVKKIQNGKFVANLQKLLVLHSDICISASNVSKPIQNIRYASSNSFINLCDFAKAIHKSYQSVYGGPDFDDLTLEFKLSNIEQAKSYAGKLELINCFYSDKELDYPIVYSWTKKNETNNNITKNRDDLGFLAREEHLRWVREKLDNGWKYGTDYSSSKERNQKKIHKDLIPFDLLPDDEKRKDEIMIENMIPLLYKYGHGVRIYSYRRGRKPTLDIAGCGHRTISMNNQKLKSQVKSILTEYQKDYRVVVRTNFAPGADQLIAECANELGITIKAAIPLPYEVYIESIRNDAKEYGYRFTAEDELKMRHLLAQTVSCKVIPDEKYTYLEASKYIIRKSEKLIALWDGVETLLKDVNDNPINQGGTWHNICIARNSRGLKAEDIHIIKCER